jgi:hypothetical protein
MLSLFGCVCVCVVSGWLVDGWGCRPELPKYYELVLVAGRALESITSADWLLHDPLYHFKGAINMAEADNPN